MPTRVVDRDLAQISLGDERVRRLMTITGINLTADLVESASIRAGATLSRSSPKAMSGRETSIEIWLAQRNVPPRPQHFVSS